MSANDWLDEKKQTAPTEPEAPALEAYLAEEEAEKPKPKPKQRRGFAILDREKHREVSRRGGVAAQASGKAHRFDAEEAKVAGRKGGFATHQRKIERENEGASS